jgi:hypothetical protein
MHGCYCCSEYSKHGSTTFCYGHFVTDILLLRQFVTITKLLRTNCYGHIVTATICYCDILLQDKLLLRQFVTRQIVTNVFDNNVTGLKNQCDWMRVSNFAVKFKLKFNTNTWVYTEKMNSNSYEIFNQLYVSTKN